MSKRRLMGRSAITVFLALFAAAPALAQETTPAPEADAGDASADEIVVTGQRAAQRRGIEIQERADNFVRAISGDEAGKLPDGNVAESVRRLPGVSVANDQGEGRFVIIRGVNPALANVTINGQTAAAPEPESRQVKLDDIPSALIGSVVLTETLTPDLDANAIAGQVNIATVTAFDRPTDFMQARGALGVTDLNDRAPYEIDGTAGGRFGANRQFGAVVSANFSQRPIGSENLQGSSNWRLVPGGFVAPDDYRIRQYTLTRSRTGAVANFDWRPSDELSLYWRNTYSKFEDHETRDQLRIPLATVTATTATTGTFTGQRATRFVRTRNEDDTTYNSTLGGKFEIGEGTLSAEVGYTRAEKKDPLRSEFQFRTSATVAGTYDTSDERYIVTPANPTFVNTASNYTFNSVNYDVRQAVETLLQGRVDYEMPFAIGEDGALKVGAKIIDRDKSNERMFRSFGPGTAFSLSSAFGPGGGTLFDGRYVFGPTVSYDGAQAFVTANPSAIVLSTSGSVANNNTSDYRAEERIAAAYAMATLHFGALTLVPGVRVENTDSEYKGKTFALTSALDQPFNIAASKSYTDWFPGVNARYDVSDTLVVRAAITTATGRPDYFYADGPGLIPTISVDAGANTVGIGNPNLEALYATNYDAAVEFYPMTGTIVAVSIFDKEIDNPIYRSSTTQSGTFAGVALTNALVSTYRNASSANVKGVEINLQHQFTWAPGVLGGFGAGINYTHTDSEATGLFGRTGSVPLFFQSPDVGTAQIFYEKYGITGRVAYSYRSAFLDTVGATAASDIYTDSNGQLDARGAYDVTEHLQVFIEGSNLNDATFRRYIGTDRQTVEEERYSWSARAGATLKF